LCFNGNQATDQENVAGLSDVPLREPCKRTFNERTTTPFNYLEYPTDIVLLVVLWRLRYKLSLRDLAEMFLDRGFEFTHEAVRDWEARFAPLMADHLRVKRRGQAGKSWYVDETYIKVKGKWCYQITVASNNAITPYVDSVVWARHHASAVPSMKYASSSASGPP
jgi:transposase-like protein